MSSRRGLLRRLAAVAGSIGLAGCAHRATPRATGPAHDLGVNPRADSLPVRQHAWNRELSRDRDGNPLPPRHHHIYFLDLEQGIDDAQERRAAATTVESALRTLEAAFDWAPRGLLHGLAWGTRYFERRGRLDDAPIREPEVLSRTDDPDLLSFDAALVLASDVPSHLTATAAAMFGTLESLQGTPVDARLDRVFRVAARRRGFVGAGLPAAHTAAEGIPSDGPPQDAPLFTGFFSGRSKTQASEDRVTIESGPYAGGTTMHVSHIDESLDDWWDVLDADGRVARMFAPEVAPGDLESFTDDVAFENSATENARRYGVAGHQQKVARAREDGAPLILRRDFNTVHGGQAGLLFVSLQRSLDDFRKTRLAMNGWYLRDDHEDIADADNNGLLEFITVRSRANFYLPPRRTRAFPE